MAAPSLTLGQILSQWRGENLAYDVSAYRSVARVIISRAEELRELSDVDLAAQLLTCREDAPAGVKDRQVLDDLLVDVYAVVLEAARRTLSLKAFEEQLIAAVALHHNKVAQLATGEGKTLVAVFAAVLNALAGMGVHVVTTNDYLARRDAKWMSPIYDLLGISVGVLTQSLDTERRAVAYGKDVTYGTATEIGFDLLRDDLALQGKSLVIRRSLFFAIYDDIDSTLIDEARHQLVISGKEEEAKAPDPKVNDAVASLEAEKDFQVDEHGERAFLTDRGSSQVEAFLGCSDLYAEESLDLLTQVNLAVHAHGVVKRDVDYIVGDRGISIIDPLKGRVAEGRRWPDGLQAAVEAKEGLPPSRGARLLASTTLQSVARLYPRLSGMTATAHKSAEELGAIYKLLVLVIPPHIPSRREDYVDLLFTHNEARDLAVLEEIKEAHKEGRPVLVGTSSVEKSESLAAALREQSISCEVLNARNNEGEAQIIANAGAIGAITISTNMAGRGTDIRLGGKDESEKDEVEELGGLCVIGTERSESERVDDQLRGRAGRQGDPGSSQFFASLKDPLFARYGNPELLPRKWRKVTSDEPILEHKAIKELDRAQRIAEARSASVRKTLWGYDAVVEGQRRRHSMQRRMLLLGRAKSRASEHMPERHEELKSLLGPRRLGALEWMVTLALMDRYWADHLARLTDLREDMQLMFATGVSIGTGFGREKPHNAFRRMAKESYEAMEDDVVEGLHAFFESEHATTGKIDLKEHGLARPKEVWPSMIKEQPLEIRPTPKLPISLAQKLVGWFSKKS